MYKLMLVDDEEDVREGVVREIDWNSHCFEVAGVAENGREALDLMERVVPDVVITDIRMPFMDGLQLAERLRSRYPAIKIIILTGFDEFEYAQRAIRLQVDEYVIKPFSANELVEVLHKVRYRIDEETAQKENVEILQEHYRRSLPILRQVFLSSLLTRRLPTKRIREQAEHYGIELDGDAFIAGVFSLDPLQKVGISGETPGSLHDADRQLQLFAVLNIAEETAGKTGIRTIFFLHNEHVAMLTFQSGGSPEEALRRTAAMAEDILQSVGKYLKLTVTAGIGPVAPSPERIFDSHKGAVLALDYRQILGSNRVICIDDIERRSPGKVRLDELQEHALVRCLKVGTKAELLETVDGLFREVAEAGVSIKEYQVYLLEIVTAILKAAKDVGVNLDDLSDDEAGLLEEMLRFTHWEEAREWMIRLSTRIMVHIASGLQNAHRTLVEEAVAYTKTNYSDPELSINKVSKHLHISAGYFCSIFKKETRTTYIQYLVQLRMEAAKELLRTTDLKAFEIAEKIGYADPNYFSFSFRKMFGITLKDYRGAARGGNA